MLKSLDSGFRRNDVPGRFQTFYEFVKIKTLISIYRYIIGFYKDLYLSARGIRHKIGYVSSIFTGLNRENGNMDSWIL